MTISCKGDNWRTSGRSLITLDNKFVLNYTKYEFNTRINTLYNHSDLVIINVIIFQRWNITIIRVIVSDAKIQTFIILFIKINEIITQDGEIIILNNENAKRNDMNMINCKTTICIHIPGDDRTPIAVLLHFGETATTYDV